MQVIDAIKETLDTITPEQWNSMNRLRQKAFINYWRKQGIVSFRCLRCGYPTYRGQGSCIACSRRG